MKINYLRNWKFAFELSETFAELNVKEKKISQLFYILKLGNIAKIL